MGISNSNKPLHYQAGQIERAYWDLNLQPGDVEVEVSFDDGVTRHPTTVEGTSSDRTTVSALITHPGTSNAPAEAVVLPAGRSVASLWVLDSPEVLPRFGGIFYAD